MQEDNTSWWVIVPLADENEVTVTLLHRIGAGPEAMDVST
jgi:hypothetical protein